MSGNNMARNKSRKKPGPEEIPQLKAMGLIAVKTAGHGNCLFHALSDQLYGDQSRHAELRADTVEYMREHPEQFKDFVIANPGGGIRRNPKRKNAGTSKGPVFDPTPPTEADINTAFDLSLDLMARGGTYGDNAEVIAFSQKHNVNICIWSAAIGAFLHIICRSAPDEAVPTLYIVHHTYEHYSSIRNVDGPLTGLPQISVKAVSPEAEIELQKELARGPKIEEWMIDLAMSSLPYNANRSIVQQTVKECRGNINMAVDLLLPESSPETSERSSSIEREADSDDEKGRNPSKKQDRRLSRPHPLSNNLAMRQKNSNPSSPSSADMRFPDGRPDLPRGDIDPDETEEEDWKENGPYPDSESASISTSASEYSTPDHSQRSNPPTRLRLSQPRKPDSPARKAALGRFEVEHQTLTKNPNRVIAKARRKRLVAGSERSANLAKKSARNQQLANHITANNNDNQQDSTAVLGIKAIRI